MAEMLKFKKPEVAKKYEATVENDVAIYRTGFHGFLSEISLSVAEAMILSKSKLIKEKKAEPTTTGKQS